MKNLTKHDKLFIQKYLKGGLTSQNVADVGTTALNLASKIPVLEEFDQAANAISGVVQDLFHSDKRLASAKHYEETGQTGYETDAINRIQNASDDTNINGNFADAIQLEVQRMFQNPSQYNYTKYQNEINKLKNEYLEKPLSGVIYPMPIRNSQLVLDKILEYVNQGFMKESNIKKYYDWSEINPNVPRLIPGTNIYEIGDNPPRLYK